ncbi:MAG TPA: alpha/beta fold hydrolase [Tepidisphaeraceae bacterium]|nr:alpha/beta fold hydrolase [Tepidisphaeraceae bacterium]
MRFIYPLMTWLYLAVPPLAVVAVGLVARRTRRARPVHVLIRACTLGAFLGGIVAFLYLSVGAVKVPFSQIVLAAYLGMSALCVVYGLNWLLWHGVSWLFRIDSRTGRGRGQWVQLAAGVVQASILIAVGLPYLGSILVLYRPKVPAPGDPQTLVDAPFQTVDFPASDGTPLEAWWIPATRNRRTDGRGSVKWGRDTVLLCHGFGADKGRDLFLAADLIANGYNVLAIDLRAHGHSGGQFTGFGGIESRDVLGAVRYLRANHADQSHRILGLGQGLGAVALIEAAADPGPDGQAISAIAAYNPYDNLRDVFTTVAEQHTIRPGQWAFMNAIVPFASAQLGFDLNGVSPAQALRALWPRPILVIGDPLSRDAIYGRSYELFQSAYQPKYSYWREDTTPADLLHDKTAALTVRIFFDEEQSIL